MTILGPAARRGPLAAGQRVQLTDAKGRLHTIQLRQGAIYHTNKGVLAHDALIGLPDGSVVRTELGHEFLALRPLLNDYVMGMPRGAAIVYPKDAGQIVQMADIFPGAVVLEAGVGSGALSMSLLSAIGQGGRLISIERREDFAQIARLNVTAWFGGVPPEWDVRVGDFSDVVPTLGVTADRVVLDMLAPWENIAVAADALAPGGVILAYVATTTQLSRFVEELRASARFAEPRSWESMVRTWHVEGLAVRPDHRMVGHTGFLVTARRLADGTVPPERTRRPAPSAQGARDHLADVPVTPENVGERTPADRKVRRVLRDLTNQASYDQEVHHD